MHYMRGWRSGNLPPKKPAPQGCTEMDDDGKPCEGVHMARGLCGRHYMRFYMCGTTELTEPQRRLPPEERFWFKVDRSAGPQGDWLWTAGKTGQGYGQFYVDGKPILAHRYAYELCIGPISEYLQVDHVWDRGCRSRLCVNPAHLEAVTLAENLRRAPAGRRAENGAKTRAHRARTAEARFWAKVDRSGGENACWPWQAFIDSSGNAKVWWQGSTRMARDIAWQMVNGPVPEGRTVRQECEQHDCMNPAHMTTVPTTQDRARRTAIAREARTRQASDQGPDVRAVFGSSQERDYGASTRGELNAGSILTADIVLECRRRYNAREATQSALAAEFGVTSGAMSNAIRGVTWAHLNRDGIPDPAVDGRSLISTPEMRERRREYGRKGADARWGGQG